MDEGLRAQAAGAMNDGLAALNEREFAAACGHFERALPLTRQLGFPQSEAAALYNIGLCRERLREPAAAHAAFAASVAIREANPDWDRYHLVEAQGWLARTLAEVGRVDEADRVLGGIWLEVLEKATEASHLFAEVVAHQAFLEQARGQVMRAEALIRRSHYLLEAIGAPTRAQDVFWDQVRLVAASRARPPERFARERAMVAVELTHTLMRWQPALRGYQGSGDLPKSWFLSVPSSWRGERLETLVGAVLIRIFADANLRLSAREPADAAYLDVTGHRCRTLEDADIARRPWTETGIVWEPSTVYLAEESWAMPLGRNEVESLTHGDREAALVALEAEAHRPPA